MTLDTQNIVSIYTFDEFQSTHCLVAGWENNFFSNKDS